MTSNYNDFAPIDVDSNGEEVAEVNNGKTKRLTTVQTGAYKPIVATGVGMALKHQKKLTSTIWDHHEFLPPYEEGNSFCKCKTCGQTYPVDSIYGIGNLKRHLVICKRKNFRDLSELLLDSCSGSLSSRRSKFEFNEFRQLLAYYVVKHELPFQFVEYDGVRDLLTYLNLDVKCVSRNTSRNDVIRSFVRE